MSYVDLIFEIMSSILLYFDKNKENITGMTDDAFSQLYNYWHSEHFMTTIFTDESEASLISEASADVSAKLSTGIGIIQK